jgi:hypothetical protein
MTEETRDTRATGGLTTADLAGGGERRDQPDQPNGMDRHDGPPSADRPAPPASAEPGAALFSTEQASTLKSRWQEVQVGFVDEPRQAVERADKLVAEVMQQLAQGFADERGALEAQWNSGQQKETEELRQAFRRYRTFFDRLLTI